MSARKFHQAVSVAFLAIAYVFGSFEGWGSAAATWLVATVGLVFLVGRFWWPADLFRQAAWRILEPRGILKRYDAVEDHSTRRVARVLGGAILLTAASLVAVGQAWAWVLIGAIGVMVFLDAAFNFCVLCEVSYRIGKARPTAQGGGR